MTELNAQWRLAARPVGLPKPTDWEYVEEPVADPADGQFVVALEYLSLDPAMRGWMNEARSYVPPVGIGEVMRAGGVGRVIAVRAIPIRGRRARVRHARRPALRDLGRDGPSRSTRRLHRCRVHLGALGVTGLTAYFGLLDIGKPKAGQTVVVSGAAGAVGSVVGQIAKIKGCRAVGIAGGAGEMRVADRGARLRCGDRLQARRPPRAQLREHTPDGVDVYFDNVGGEILDEALRRLARGARVAICGAISQYNAAAAAARPGELHAAARAARVDDRVPRVRLRRALPRGDRAARGAGCAPGELGSREDVVPGGVEAFPDVC